MNFPKDTPSYPPFSLPAYGLESNAEKIEDYLDHVLAPLVGSTSYARRQEMRSEIRDHLLALAQAYEELGSPREDAVVRAIDRFGSPNVVSSSWLKPETGDTADFRSQAILVARSFGLMAFVSCILAAIYGQWNQPGAINDTGNYDLLYLMTVLYVLPLATGIYLGDRIRGTFPWRTVSLLFLVPLMCSPLVWNIQSNGLPIPMADPRGFPLFMLWLPMVMLGYTLKGWIHRFSNTLSRKFVAR